MTTQTFQPFDAQTVSITVGAASARTQIPHAAEDCPIRIKNAGTAEVWVRFGDSTVVAANTDINLGVGETVVWALNLPASGDLWMAAIAAAATGKVYATAGQYVSN